jgi:hypothetical protein
MRSSGTAATRGRRPGAEGAEEVAAAAAMVVPALTVAAAAAVTRAAIPYCPMPPRSLLHAAPARTDETKC